MKEVDMSYIDNQKNDKRVIRTEILFTPVLVALPICVGILFIYEWYTHSIIDSISGYFGMLILGIILIVGNIIFDIPFIRSLLRFFKKKKVN